MRKETRTRELQKIHSCVPHAPRRGPSPWGEKEGGGGRASREGRGRGATGARGGEGTTEKALHPEKIHYLHVFVCLPVAADTETEEDNEDKDDEQGKRTTRTPPGSRAPANQQQADAEYSTYATCAQGRVTEVQALRAQMAALAQAIGALAVSEEAE
jgi:hypothetical protein